MKIKILIDINNVMEFKNVLKETLSITDGYIKFKNQENEKIKTYGFSIVNILGWEEEF
jgi:hypothetical protein